MTTNRPYDDPSPREIVEPKPICKLTSAPERNSTTESRTIRHLLACDGDMQNTRHAMLTKQERRVLGILANRLELGA